MRMKSPRLVAMAPRIQGWEVAGSHKPLLVVVVVVGVRKGLEVVAVMVMVMVEGGSCSGREVEETVEVENGSKLEVVVMEGVENCSELEVVVVEVMGIVVASNELVMVVMVRGVVVSILHMVEVEVEVVLHKEVEMVVVVEVVNGVAVVVSAAEEVAGEAEKTGEEEEVGANLAVEVVGNGHNMAEMVKAVEVMAEAVRAMVEVETWLVEEAEIVVAAAAVVEEGVSKLVEAAKGVEEGVRKLVGAAKVVVVEEEEEATKPVEVVAEAAALAEKANHPREFSSEPVVAEIELEEELQVLELVRDCTAEPIRVDVKQCQICEESELLREVPGDVAVVEIDASDGEDRGVVRRRSAENSGVLANTRSDPIACEVLGIGENSFFPSLESNVGCSETRVWEDQRWTNGHKLASVSELVSVVQKLSLLDVQSFGVGEAAIDGEVGMRSSRRDEEEEREKKEV
ncbi:hypothetical protein HYC85_025858 [Camellia sinensis]|uniref:Uncharacterized protein n=1 Tax=Camellia sinensis TaxID=4442 RepID=A0A7J7G228_CAMSI|nr:hypothetical protein HYC85_025858 [Camellia sinensis]